MNTYDAARKNGNADELHRQLVILANGHNPGANSGTLIPATLMQVTAAV